MTKNKLFKLAIISSLFVGFTGCQSKQESEETSTTSTAEEATAVVKTATTENVEMDYVTFGNGKKNFVIIPGLSIHSVMGSADAIAESYKDFTEEYTVYVFDRPKTLKEGCTNEDIANDTATILKSLNLEQIDVFGASQGGMIALYLAINHPELIHSVILGSTLSKTNDTFTQVVNEWINLAKEKDENALLESFAQKVYSKATYDAYHDVLISSNKGITDEEYERFIIQANACLTIDCYDKLSSIKCPVLVLGSEGDQVVTALGSQEIADKLNCEIYLYDENYGHGVYDEATDYKQRCLDFFHSIN